MYYGHTFGRSVGRTFGRSDNVKTVYPPTNIVCGGPSMILEVIKETKYYGHTFGWSVGRTDRQRENSIPSHKHSLRRV